tara:strand:- start:1427 stop:2293 length:867 start_codon:yes stop_codon:yes gene_type:complete
MNDKIFVSIASYRDPQTSSTIKSLLNNAKFPDNIRIGVIEQNLKNDWWFGVTHKKGSIRVLRLSEGKGPAYARFLASTLWNSEKWYLQIDSHMKFIKNWDVILIDEMKKCDGPRCILTCYPPPNLPLENVRVRSITENWSTDKQGHVIAQGKIIPGSEKPSLGIFVSAGFMFFESALFLKEIPYDPCLKFLFQGEEILLSGRLFTRGWKIYHPSCCVCAHDYIRKDDPKVWNDSKNFWKNNEKVVRKYRYLTHQLKSGPPKNPGIYGLGTERSPEQWKKAIGLTQLFD